jgi:hypothetical protein
MNKEVIRTVVFSALLLATACGGGTNLPPAQSEGQPANVQLLSDIPIPSDATMDNDRSLILSDRDHWTGRVVMRFWHSTADLTNFYLGQMPGFGWEPVMTVTSDITILSYVRGDRAATVQIERTAMGMKSVVSVTVAPRAAGGPTGAATGGPVGGNAVGTVSQSPGYPSGDAASARPPVRAETLSSPNRR